MFINDILIYSLVRFDKQVHGRRKADAHADATIVTKYMLKNNTKINSGFSTFKLQKNT